LVQYQNMMVVSSEVSDEVRIKTWVKSRPPDS
jgi:hypothetical protein